MTTLDAPALTLRLPWQSPPLSMNDIRRKGHWTQQQRAHDNVRDAVWALCRQAKAARLTETVVVGLTWHAKGRGRRDPDSLGAMVKGALDGLTAAGVLDDDSAAYVDHVRLAVRVGADDPRIELTVTLA